MPALFSENAGQQQKIAKIAKRIWYSSHKLTSKQASILRYAIESHGRVSPSQAECITAMYVHNVKHKHPKAFRKSSPA